VQMTTSNSQLADYSRPQTIALLACRFAHDSSSAMRQREPKPAGVFSVCYRTGMRRCRFDLRRTLRNFAQQ
jgi:hypothetical protein